MIRALARRAWGETRRLRRDRGVRVRSLAIASGLHGRLALPATRPLAGVLVVPGLGGTAASLERWDGPVALAEVAALGVAALALDLSGRGESEGREDHGGPSHQEDVRKALGSLAALPEVEGPLGVISLSLGCAAVAGALARGERPEVAWWIDWEGPSDREIITAGGRLLAPAMGRGLEDEDHWRPREAVRWVGSTGVAYLRYQAARDHAQPGEVRHAERMVRAALAGDLPRVRLNDHPPGTLPDRPHWMPGGIRNARAWILAEVRAATGSEAGSSSLRGSHGP